MTRRDGVALAIIIAVVTLIFSDLIFFGRSFYFRDVTRFYFPMQKVTRDIILSGEFPSWNPYLSEGQPLAANPEFGVFYPPNWLLLLPDYEAAFRLHAVLHFYIAAIGMYLLLRAWRLRVESAMFGAFALTFGGLLLSSANLFPYLFSLPWVPWLMLFLTRTLRTPPQQVLQGRMRGRRRQNVALASLALAMIFLCGEPVMVTQVGVIAVTYTLWRRDDEPSRARRVILGGVIVAAALLLASVQLVPAIDHLRDSVRSQPFPFTLVSFWSTPPLRAIELLIPGVFGPTGDHAMFYWGTAAYRWADPFLLSIYPGLLVTALAFSAISLKRGRWALVLASLICGYVLAIGSTTPLLRWLYDAHLYSSFRFPEKFWMLALLPLTAYAAYAFDCLIEGDNRIARRALVVAIVAASICALLAIVALTPGYTSAFVRFWSIEVHPLAGRMAALSMGTWLIGLLRSAVVVALLLLRKRFLPGVWPRLAIIVLVIDLGFERMSAAETIDHAFFAERPQTIPAIQQQVRVFHQADWYGTTGISRSYFDLPEMYWVVRNGGYPHVGAAYGIESALNRDIDRTALLPTGELLGAVTDVRARTPDWVQRLAAISNAGYRAMFVSRDQAGRGAAIRPIMFAPVPTNPRFYFADRVMHCRSRDEFVNAITATDWTRRSTCADTAPFTPAGGEVLTTELHSNRAKLRVRASGDSLLVASVTRHKYWRAWIDGQPATLLAANLAYQAVRLPAGDHDVELRYANPLTRIFGFVSLATLLIMLILAIIPTRDRAQL